MEPSQLEQYFARIQYSGPREPSLAVLNALTAAHAQHIPFENLDILLGLAIDLSDAAVFDKLVARKRGGYCFEQNGLFLRVLAALGFEVAALSARGRMIQTGHPVPPRTHVFLKVMVDGVQWITDVGMGALSLTAALRFELDVPQSTPHDTRRIVRRGDVYLQQVLFDDRWMDVFELTGEEMPHIDRIVANWYTSAHPHSHFKNRLIVARAGEDGRRHTLLNHEHKVRERDGSSVVQTIATPEQLIALLATQFGLRFPPGTRFNLAETPPA